MFCIVRNRQFNQNGRASVFALLSTAAVFYYVKEGHNYFGEGLHPAVYFGTLSILLIIAVFSIGCTIHLKLLGSKSNKVLYRELEQRTRNLEAFLLEIRKKLATYEKQMLQHTSTAPRKAIDCLGYARKIAAAVETRIADVRELMDLDTELDLIDAYDLMRRKLIVVESSLNSLIDTDPIPALDPLDWEPTLERLTLQIEAELKQLAA